MYEGLDKYLGIDGKALQFLKEADKWARGEDSDIPHPALRRRDNKRTTAEKIIAGLLYRYHLEHAGRDFDAHLQKLRRSRANRDAGNKLKVSKKVNSDKKREDAKRALRGLRTLKPADAIKQLAKNGEFSRSFLYDVADELGWTKKRKSANGR